MQKTKSVDSYVNDHQKWKNELTTLRALLNETELTECIKWGAPCYTFNGENIVGMMGFKNYVGIWFHQGVFLEDKAGVLVNAQEGKTKALRQWRFSSAQDIKADLIRNYIAEAIENAKAGKKVSPAKPKPLSIPPELTQALDQDTVAREKFEALKPGQKKEFAAYIKDAKRMDTKIRRIKKIIPMINSGIGLNDKYK
ncbi:MAG: hypothetical protein EX271_09090 [Acidimicrobiales bacterium]|nr:hypothetical protein [Hyphomonadaceae bacterium]RZV40943.1 MAG: hypothetical protein EX271_09090 [Acidimicrobiales bacterium]